MATTEHAKLAEVLALPATERLALVEAIWDSLAACPDQVPVPDQHLGTLAERLADDDHDERPGTTWSDLRDRLSKAR